MNEYVGCSHQEPEVARRGEVALLSIVLGQVLREAGLVEVAAEHLARALTVHLLLVNLADERHRARLLQNQRHLGEADAGDALWPAVSAARGEVLSRLDRSRIQPVLTAPAAGQNTG